MAGGSFSGAKDWCFDMSSDAFPDDTLRCSVSKTIDCRHSVDGKPLRPDAGYREMPAAVDHPLPQNGPLPSAIIDELAMIA